VCVRTKVNRCQRSRYSGGYSGSAVVVATKVAKICVCTASRKVRRDVFGLDGVKRCCTWEQRLQHQDLVDARVNVCSECCVT